MGQMKTFLTIATILLMSLGLIVMIGELSIMIGSLGLYIFGLGISLLIILGGFEIYERSK